ncbi:MAG: glycoside hydrolase family 3 protein [Treponema sp.]|jgi:beta-N-acetylhexosaminidase|nr:glycoside hydrolase family 3 protein [Treponema sp.]
MIGVIPSCEAAPAAEKAGPAAAPSPAAKNSEDPRVRQRAAELAASLDRKKLAAQVILTAVEGRGSVPPRTRELLSEIPAGGIMLFSRNVSQDPENSRTFIGALVQCVASLSVPPFIASDQEGGRVQRFRDKAALPPPLSYWENFQKAATEAGGAGKNSVERRATILAVENNAALAGRELRRLGVNLNLAPLAEPLTAENSPFIQDRSYGPSQEFTREAAAAFVRGMERVGVACTLKHFPGNSGADPHRKKAELALSGTELNALVAPFAYVIREESPAVVMLSHVIVPSWDTRPSSLSPGAVRRLRALGFNGIILADDFIMAAAGDLVEVCAVKALKAGVDMIMAWPADLRKIHQALLAALDGGDLTEERLREAAERILYQKIRYGLIQ